MSLFGKRKHMEENPAASAGASSVLVLGSGCPKCRALERAAKDALASLGRPPEVGHVTDYAAIASYGVMSLPALVVNGKVVLSGRVPGTAELAALLAKVPD